MTFDEWFVNFCESKAKYPTQDEIWQASRQSLARELVEELKWIVENKGFHPNHNIGILSAIQVIEKKEGLE